MAGIKETICTVCKLQMIKSLTMITDSVNEWYPILSKRKHNEHSFGSSSDELLEKGGIR
jgi:hypothetical protein